MTGRLHTMRTCVALRIAMQHLEKVDGPRAAQASELLLLASELLLEESSITTTDVVDAVLDATDVAGGNGDDDGIKQAH